MESESKNLFTPIPLRPLPPLMQAVITLQVDAVKALLQAGADPNYCYKGNTALNLLLKFKWGHLFDKARIASSHYFPSHNIWQLDQKYAAILNIAYQLIEAGTNLKLRNVDGELPLDYALRAGCSELVSRLENASYFETMAGKRKNAASEESACKRMR